VFVVRCGAGAGYNFNATPGLVMICALVQATLMLFRDGSVLILAGSTALAASGQLHQRDLALCTLVRAGRGPPTPKKSSSAGPST
jgi:hypothetical protein